MPRTFRAILIFGIGALLATYFGIALYLALLPGSEAPIDSLKAAIFFLAGLLLPAFGIAVTIGLAVSLAAGSMGRAAFTTIFGVAAAVGGAVLGYLATYRTPAIPTPLAMECMSAMWFFAGTACGLVARGHQV